MTHTLATEPSRQQAVDEVRSLKKPKDMSRTQWRSVRRVLSVIAKHYPKAMPSVATIGTEAKLSVNQARRVLYIAEAAGLLVILHDAGTGKHCINKTSRYHIATLMKDGSPPISGEEMGEEGSPSENSLPTVVSPPRSNERPRFARPVAAATFEEPSRDVGPPPEPEPEPEVWSMSDALARANGFGHQDRPVFQVQPGNTPARSLVRYFSWEWKLFVKAHTMYANHRPFDSRSEAGKYLKDTFLAPTEGVVYTEAQVRDIIDEFFVGLVNLRNRIKPGQSAWRRFTATWQPPGGVSQQPSSVGAEWWKK